MGAVIYFDFKKKEQFEVDKCSFCQNEYKRYTENPQDPRNIPVFCTRDHKHSICAICVKIFGSQLK